MKWGRYEAQRGKTYCPGHATRGWQSQNLNTQLQDPDNVEPPSAGHRSLLRMRGPRPSSPRAPSGGPERARAGPAGTGGSDARADSLRPAPRPRASSRLAIYRIRAGREVTAQARRGRERGALGAPTTGQPGVSLDGGLSWVCPVLQFWVCVILCL